jgi:hypothetical protein
MAYPLKFPMVFPMAFSMAFPMAFPRVFAKMFQKTQSPMKISIQITKLPLNLFPMFPYLFPFRKLQSRLYSSNTP